jgi:hypothetical protein
MFKHSKGRHMSSVFVTLIDVFAAFSCSWGMAIIYTKNFKLDYTELSDDLWKLFCVVKIIVSKGHHDECHYAECCYAECHYAGILRFYGWYTQLMPYFHWWSLLAKMSAVSGHDYSTPYLPWLHLLVQHNGRQSTVNRSLDGSIYPG